MKSWLRKAQSVLMLALASLPAALLMGVNGFADQMGLCGVFAGLYLISALISISVKGKWRLMTGVVFAALILAAGWMLLPWQERNWWLLILPIGYVILLFYSLPIGGWETGRELPFTVSFTGGGLFAAAQIMQMIPSGIYAAIQMPLLISFLTYAVLWMFSLNRQSLQEASARGQGASEGIKRKNRMLTIGLMALILILSSIPAIGRAMAWLWEKCLYVVGRLAAFLASLLPEASVGEGSGGGAQDMGMLGPAAEPSAFAVLMEKIFMALALIGFAVAVFFALRIVWKKLRILARKLWTLLNRYALAASEDYVDEVADTRGTGETVFSGGRGLFDNWFRQVNEEKLTPVERVRYRYRRLLRRHQEWQPGSTARENLPQGAAVIYERARYSGADITPQEAETFAQQAKSMEKNG